MNKLTITMLGVVALALITTASMADLSSDRMGQLSNASTLAQKAQNDVAQFQQQQQQKFAAMQKRLASPNAQNLNSAPAANSPVPAASQAPMANPQPSAAPAPTNNNITGFSSSPDNSANSSGDSGGWSRDYY